MSSFLGKKKGSFESVDNMYPRVKVRKDEEPATIQKEERSYTVRAVESLHLESHLTRILVSTHGSRSENDIQPPRAKISMPRQKSPLTPSIAASNGMNNNRSNEDNKTKSNGLNSDKRCQNDSDLPHARISDSHPKISLMPSIVASKHVQDLKLKNKDGYEEDSKLNKKASSKVKNNDGSDEDNKTYIRASPVPPPRAVLSSPDNDGIIGSQNQRIQEKQTTLRRQKQKSDGKTATQNQIVGEKKAVSDSPKLEVLGKLSCTKVKSLQCTGKASKETGNSEIVKGKRWSDLSTPKQRPPFKVT